MNTSLEKYDIVHKYEPVYMSISEQSCKRDVCNWGNMVIKRTIFTNK